VTALPCEMQKVIFQQLVRLSIRCCYWTRSQSMKMGLFFSDITVVPLQSYRSNLMRAQVETKKRGICTMSPAHPYFICASDYQQIHNSLVSVTLSFEPTSFLFNLTPYIANIITQQSTDRVLWRSWPIIDTATLH